jgi:hypothetical protein
MKLFPQLILVRCLVVFGGLALCLVSSEVKAQLAQALSDVQVTELADALTKIQSAPGGADAPNEPSAELIVCWANTLVASTCLANTPGSDAVAKRTRDISDWLSRLGFEIGFRIGVTEQALDARMRLAVDGLKQRVPSCYNMSIVTLQYRESCQQLVASPSVRLLQIMCRKDKRFC